MTRARRPPRVPTGVLLLGVALAAACAGPGQPPELPALSRPEWRVGDRWVFRHLTPTGPPAVVTHEITAATGDAYTMRTRGLGQEVSRRWSLELAVAEQRAGAATGRFDPPVRYFAWPLTLGQGWSQEFEFRQGPAVERHRHRWRVGPTVEPVDVPAGPFYAVRIEHWGSREERLDTYWYVPQARYWVRLESYLGGYTEELVELALSRP